MTDETAMTYCPDCDRHIPTARFVEHREREHPPETIVLIANGIESQERHGYTPADD